MRQYGRHPSPDKLEALMRRAHRMRAEALAAMLVGAWRRLALAKARLRRYARHELRYMS